MSKMRVQKFLSKAGVCSRRQGEQYMLDGRVAVNGELCTTLGSKVDPATDEVKVDGQLVELPQSYDYILLHKPKSYISTLDDPKGRPTVVDLLDDDLPRVWPVGRLDWDSEGLLLMTNDGKLTNLITHPSHQIKKTYVVRVRGTIHNQDAKIKKLRTGINLGGGETSRPASVQVMSDHGTTTDLQVGIHEGKNRQIRRMFDAVGHEVLRLQRVAIGPLTIGTLPPGKTRRLRPQEVADLYEWMDAEMPKRADQR